MKKVLIIITVLTMSTTLSAQIWVEGMAVYSIPTKAFMSSGGRTLYLDGLDPIELDNQDLFITYAKPSFGGGANLRYVYGSSQWVVGIEMSYVEYQPETDLARLTMFRIGPTLEYYFLAEKVFQPYLGAEVGLLQAKAFFNGEVVNEGQISDTYFGYGLRGGFVFDFSSRWAFRLGAKYVYSKKLPFVDITAGIALNLGDF